MAPRAWTKLRRDCYPGLVDRLEIKLYICSNGVATLDLAALDASISNDIICGVYPCGAGRQFLKDCGSTMFVLYAISAKDDASFVLMLRCWHLCEVDGAGRHEISKVYCLAFALGFCNQVVSFDH